MFFSFIDEKTNAYNVHMKNKHALKTAKQMSAKIANMRKSTKRIKMNEYK